MIEMKSSYSSLYMLGKKNKCKWKKGIIIWIRRTNEQKNR